MGKWIITDGAETDGNLFEAESFGDGTVSLHIPSQHPVIVSKEKAQQIRLIIGAAIEADPT